MKFSDRDPAIELAITEIAGHLTFTPNTVTAWYWLPEVRWAFRPDAEREALLAAISEQYAGLAGFRLHLRRTTRPFPADEWARTVDAHTPHPLAAVPGAASWSDHLVAAQRHLLSVNHAEGQTYLGVTFARRSLGNSLTERILRTFGRGVADGERRKLGRTVEQFDEVLGAFGMRGRRVTAGELEWLLYRSVALCMAPPGTLSPITNGQWERGDLLALTEQVERYRSPYGSTVKLVNRMTGEERHVAVLAVGRMEPLEIPERHEPWLHFHERLPWPMELSTRVDVLGSGDSFRNLEHRLRMIRSQQLDYAEHGIDAPPELERLAKRALVIGDEMTTGLPVDSARAHGWHRIAVGGRTREECLERARRLIQLYSRELRISLQHPKNQDWLAREFIPGEPIANTGYIRRMPVNLLAAALPQAASTVGDRRGDLIGRTAGTCRRPVFLDLHFPMEVRERSGLAVFVAEPGGGKSTLLGALGYLAARRGVQVTLLDPSGPLARLCAMPELRPYSRVLNLTGSEQGTLAPYALIPTPLRSEFPTGAGGDREFEIAISNSRAERRMLVQDICMMLVPPQVAREASTATLLRHAVRQVPAEETSTLDDVVACLATLDDDEGKELANLLLDTAEMPLALLFFGRPPAGLLGADAALTVITMAGLRLPDLKIEREYWSAEEALALPMLHTAHRLAVRRCYGGSMGSRKMVGLDEAHFMEGWRSGRSFLVRLARDSRKWNLSALVASQNPRDILGLDVQNLVSTVFVGRIAEDAEIASEALRLLRVPVNDGYEATLASLSSVGRVLGRPARLPRIRHARRRRTGAEDPGRRVVRRGPARPPGHHPGQRRLDPGQPAHSPRGPGGLTWRGPAYAASRSSSPSPCSRWRPSSWPLFGAATASAAPSARCRPRRRPTSAPPRSGRPTSGSAWTGSRTSAGATARVPGRRPPRARPTPASPAGSPPGRTRPRSAATQGCTATTATPATATTTYDMEGGCASTVVNPAKLRAHQGGQRRIDGGDRDHRRVERAARAGVGPADHVGVGRSAGRAGDQGGLPEGLQRLRHHHPLRGRALPALAVAAVRDERTR